MKTHKILFVCLGNICRSPMAEYVLRHRAREAGMGNAVITSQRRHIRLARRRKHARGTRRALKQHGIDPSGFTSSKIKPSDAEHFDYIIVMDDNNLRETEKQLGFHPGKIFKLTDLIPDSGYNHVPDPWYTGDFDETYRLVDAGSLALLEKLKQA